MIAVALIALMLGCVEERPGYEIIIRSTEGGLVTTPGEWMFIYKKRNGGQLAQRIDFSLNRYFTIFIEVG
jgi:hypothetical protein